MAEKNKKKTQVFTSCLCSNTYEVTNSSTADVDSLQELLCQAKGLFQLSESSTEFWFDDGPKDFRGCHIWRGFSLEQTSPKEIRFDSKYICVQDNLKTLVEKLIGRNYTPTEV